MRKVFITGSTRGIGLSLAKRFLADQNYLLIAHGKKDLGKSEIENIFGSQNSERLRYLALDLSDPVDVQKRELNLEGLDIFINNAGVYQSESPIETVNINLVSAILLVEKIYPLISKSCGAIININSLAGLYPNFRESVYCASKFGLDGFFKSLQSESYKDKVEISQYYLGATQSDMTKARSDFELLIDPDELAELIFNSVNLETILPVGQILKRKKY